MIVWLYDLSKTLQGWEEALFRVVNKITSSPAFPAAITLILFAIGCWAISYFTKK